jgi:hypothetical protein
VRGVVIVACNNAFDVLGHSVDRTFKKCEMFQEKLQHEAMVFGNSTMKSFSQLWNLFPQARASLIRKNRFVRFASDHRLDHIPSGDPEHISRNRCELDIGILEYLVNAVGNSRPLRHELSAVTSEISKMPQCTRRHKARLEKAVL